MGLCPGPEPFTVGAWLANPRGSLVHKPQAHMKMPGARTEGPPPPSPAGQGEAEGGGPLKAPGFPSFRKGVKADLRREAAELCTKVEGARARVQGQLQRTPFGKGQALGRQHAHSMDGAACVRKDRAQKGGG